MEESQTEINNAATESVEATNQESYTNNVPEPDWRSALPPELQQIASRYETVESALRALDSAQGLIGRKVSDFSREDWQTYAAMMQNATGVPADAASYQLKTPEDATNCLSKDDVDAVRDIAEMLQFTNEQAQGICNILNGFGNAWFENQSQQCVECFSQLGQMWGNEYRGKLQALDQCVNNIFPQLMGISANEVKTKLAGALTSSHLVNLLATIGELCMDSTSQGYGNLSPTDASIRLEQMKADPTTTQIMMNPHHPMHSQVKSEFRTLLAMKG